MADPLPYHLYRTLGNRDAALNRSIFGLGCLKFHQLTQNRGAVYNLIREQGEYWLRARLRTSSVEAPESGPGKIYVSAI